MLNKLFRHELKATGRYLIPLYLLLLVVSVFDRLVLKLDIFHGALVIVPGFLTMAYIVSIIAIVVVTFVLMIMRFYKNLLGDEGYLMFTLPVRADQHLNVKLITSMLWTLLSFLTVIASLFIAFATPDVMRDIAEGFRDVVAELDKAFGGLSVLLIIEFIVMVLLGLAMNILLIYVSIAVGQLFNGHRVLGSFAAYMAIYTVSQIFMAIVIGIGGYTFRGSLEELNSVPGIVMPVGILIALAFNAAYYFAINYIFRKKLNLE